MQRELRVQHRVFLLSRDLAGLVYGRAGWVLFHKVRLKCDYTMQK